MGTTTALTLLLRSLCHSRQWKYAVFWKLKHQSQTLLTWEDSYFENAKPGVALENAPQKGLFSGKPGIISFGCDVEAKNGSSAGCPIELAVANISSHSYSLGEGIIGKAALTGKHYWIFSSEFNSILPPECPREWQLQFAAGVKTILLVPVFPHGVIQLGSLKKVMEDLTVVAHIRDLFNALQHTTGTCTASTSRMDLFNPFSPFSTPLTGNFPVSSDLTGYLSNPLQSQLSAKKDMLDPDLGQATKSALSTISPHLLQLLLVQEDHSLSQHVMDQVLGTDIKLCTDATIWEAMDCELFVDPTEAPFIRNQSMQTDEIIEGDISNFSWLEDEATVSLQSNVINGRLFPKQSIMSNSYEEDLEHGGYSFCYVKETTGQPFGKELAEGTFSEIEDRFLNFPVDSELHKALGVDLLKEHDVCIENTILPEEDQLSCSAAIRRIEVSEANEPLVGESNAWLPNGSGTEHLLDAIIADLQYVSDDNASGLSRCTRSRSNSSGKRAGSCLTQCKSDVDVSGLYGSGPWSHAKSAFISKNEVLTISPTGSLSKSINMSMNEDQKNENMRYGQHKKGLKLSHVSKRRGKAGDLHRPRPRDRQLIQDRVKELRELVPNGSKCSIDALLDQTIKHMLFLQSISSQADKLKDCAHPKVKVDNSNLSGAHQHGTSWAYELGGNSEECPLIIEDLDQPGKMLVEMVCKEYGLFLEIAQVIRRLELTILKGVLESRADKMWAHFIIEASRGFHRMDILWPLMQLLQRNRTTIPSKF